MPPHTTLCPPLPLQRGKDANDLLASLFSWAVGWPVAPAAVERCFPLVPHGKVLMPYVLWDRISELGALLMLLLVLLLLLFCAAAAVLLGTGCRCLPKGGCCCCGCAFHLCSWGSVGQPEQPCEEDGNPCCMLLRWRLSSALLAEVLHPVDN